jgi:hypothetical protein
MPPDKEKQIVRMMELMRPIDRQIMMCDNQNDLLLLASIMTTTALRIYMQNLGGKGAKTLFQQMTDDIDEKILPLGGALPPDNSK